MIKRYEMGLVCSAIQKPDGEWVKFEDHVADKRELVEMLQRIWDEHEIHSNDCLREALSALIAKHNLPIATLIPPVLPGACTTAADTHAPHSPHQDDPKP